MDIGQWIKDWATPLGAGATLVAVIVALWIGLKSISQTKNIQKKERIERMLNEILDWLRRIEIQLFPYDTKTTKEMLEESTLGKRTGLDMESMIILSHSDENSLNLNLLFQANRDCNYMIKMALKIDIRLYKMLTKLNLLLSDRPKLMLDTNQERLNIVLNSVKMFKELERAVSQGQDHIKNFESSENKSSDIVKLNKNYNDIHKCINKAIDKLIEIKSSL
ncbi:MAG: hypothetical protein PHG35_01740 [Dehalococcoidales bacterium]|nr:hypothetical protein [Dehalococcoidales bacterium]